MLYCTFLYCTILYCTDTVPCNISIKFIITNLSNPVMLRKPVVIKNREHEGFVEGVSVGKVLELESFIEKWIQSFPMNFRFKLLLPFLRGQHEHLEEKECNISLTENSHNLMRTIRCVVVTPPLCRLFI